MKTTRTAVLVSLALALSPVVHGGEEHHHHGHTETPHKLQLNAGKKWQTDAPLRQSMEGINGAMAKALPLIHGNRFDDGAYQALAATVNQEVAAAVAQCKLEPRADAMLHLVMADLLAGAETMEGKGAGSRHDGAVKVLHALDAYGRHFQHRGWKTARG